MSIKPKQIILLILLLSVLGGVIFLTLQGPEDTINLSESFRKVALQIGYTGDSRQFRSDIHIIEYFIVGLFAVIFVKSVGVKIWIGILSTCAIGILDETVKILLPTREFSFIDLIKDFAGVVIAFTMFILICFLFNKNKASSSIVFDRQGSKN